MNSVDCELTRANLDKFLKDAHEALDGGHVQAGRELSHRVLKMAQVLDDKHYEAKALLCLAHCDRMLSHYRRAHRASQRAAHGFQLLGDTSGEVMALTTHAFVAINLGRNEEAVEAALLSVRLSELLDKDEHSVLSYNALGAAYFWSHHFDKAEQALRTAIEIAEHAKPPLSTFQSQVNQWWAQVIRIFYERYFDGELPSLALMRVTRESITQRVASRHGATNPLSNSATTEAVLSFGTSLDACWHGQLNQAQDAADALNGWAQHYGTLTWLSALEAWARTEIAWARQDWPGAMQQVAHLIEIAVTVEHEQLACLGHLLASQLYMAQGLNGPALDELRRLRLREQLIRCDCLETRENVIDWQLNLRQRQHNIDRLERTSRQLEKLSLEDTLTNIPNRRGFERYAAELLRFGLERSQPPCVALVDMDNFKTINDKFSHQVGDEVLKRIAQILKTWIREEDMVARLGGDEFIIVFKTADLKVVQLVCQRISIAVEEFVWSTIGAGLQASISVGIARATPGDTVATLTHRADTAMYAEKKKKHDQSA
ncbi:MAG: tetratricopeptide repeat-containing diguanylate cyclase [Comamonadaceae bacterium]